MARCLVCCIGIHRPAPSVWVVPLCRVGHVLCAVPGYTRPGVCGLDVWCACLRVGVGFVSQGSSAAVRYPHGSKSVIRNEVR